MRSIAVICSLFFFIVVCSAHAATLEGVSFPDEVQLEGKTLALNGLGLREATFLKVDVYVAGLYLEQKNSDPAAILKSDELKRLRMHFVREVDAKKIRDAWTEGFKKNALAYEPLKDRIEQFNALMSDLKEGSEIVLDFHGENVSIVASGQKGSIEGKDFAEGLLAIWLGKNPPNPELKKGLLGN